jgi:asparagine synthase (glutamine-hydrolysing)
MRDGKAADRSCVAQMAAAVPHRAPDGAWIFQDGPFAVARLQTFCTDEDARERGAVVSHKPRASLAFDGRLDNRADLASELGIAPPELRTMPDAALALRGWLRWREALPDKLLGDFAIVAWDPEARLVFCATDTFGIRPLHYYLSSRVLVFATEIAQLFANRVVPRRPDDKGVGELLCGDPRTPGLTAYAHVQRLPHAHALTVEPAREHLRRYWTPETAPVLRRDDAEYAEAFREQFDRAVKARLRSRGRVGAHLSGGLDSSSVLVSAAVAAPLTRLTAVSLGFETPAADERRFVDAVLAHSGMEGIRLAPPAFDASEVRRQVRQRHYLPDLPNSWGAGSLRRAMADLGIRVCLTGAGGDIGLAGTDFYLGDLLKGGHLARLVRRYRDAAALRAGGVRSVSFVRCALWPAAPNGVRALLRPFARRFVRPQVPRWISPSFCSRTGLGEPPAPATRASSAANQTIARGYDDGLTHLVHDLYEMGSSEAHIYDRHPFLDRRLVEFILRLPDDQRWQRSQTKFVLRQAMGARLPSAVRDRSDRSKAEFSHVITEALDAIGGRAFFEHLSIESTGWVVPGALAALHDRMHVLRAANNPAYRDLSWQLWSAAAVEFWHSGVFGNQSEEISWTSTVKTTARRASRTPAISVGGPIVAPSSSSTVPWPS